MQAIVLIIFKNVFIYLVMKVFFVFATFIKRPSKAKDKKLFALGIRFAKDEARKHVPNYKNNRYICSGGMKNKYLKYFNGIFARLVYLRERDRMN